MASTSTPSLANPPPRPLTSSEPAKPALNPGSFHSVLPQLNSVLAAIGNLAENEEVVGQVEASEAVAGKARELHSALESMKATAISLPGGDLSRDEIQALEGRLEEEAEKRRRLLSKFASAVPSITASVPPSDPKRAMDDEAAARDLTD